MRAGMIVAVSLLISGGLLLALICISALVIGIYAFGEIREAMSDRKLWGD